MMQAEPAANHVPYTLAQEPTHGLLQKFVIQITFLQRIP